MERLEDALREAWADAESGVRERAVAAVDAFRGLIPRAIAEGGEASDAYCSALRGLAYALDETGEQAESREMYEVLADVWERRHDALPPQGGTAPDELPERAEALNQALHARALSALIGAGDDDAVPVLSQLDALIARSEVELGREFGGTLWLLARRAQFMVRVRGAEALDAYDLLIARAAAGGEGEHNHLMALAEKATELSRLDRDEEAALIWERVLEGRRALLGIEDPATLDAWWWLARTLWWSGSDERARREAELLLPAMQRVHGEDAPQTLEVMRFLIGDLQKQGTERDGDAELTRALDLVRRVAQLEAARFGPESRQVFASRGKAVDLLDDLARYEEARPEAAALAAEALAALGPDEPLHISIGVTRQYVLGHLAEREDGDERDAVRAEGVVAAEELCELAVEQALTIARAAGDPEDRVASFARVVHYPANWWDPGTQERVDALERWVERLATLSASELSGQPGLVRAEIELRDRLARDYFNAEALERALAQYERSLELERSLALHPTTAAAAPGRTAQSVDAVAATLRRLGRAEEAEAMLARAIPEAEQAGVAAETIADLRNTRSLVLQELGRYDEAASEGRALWEASGDPGRALDLSVVYVNADRHAEAEALLKPVLAKLEADGEGHSGTALRIRGNLALVACAQDRDAEAAVTYDELLELQREVLGPHHRDVFITMHNRALEERHLKNYPEAVRRFAEVVRLRTEHLGERDPQTLTSLYNLAGAHELAGDISQAGPMLDRVVALSRDVLGATHPSTLRRAGDLQKFTEKWGAHGEAGGSRGDESLHEQFTASGDGHALLRYADHLLDRDRPGDALIEYAKARDALAGAGGLPLLAAERGIAETHRRMGNHREAAEAFAKVAPQIERLLPDDRWALANALNAQGTALSRLDRVDEMIRVRQRAIEVADSAGSDVDRTVWLRLWLGRALRSHGQSDESLIHHREEGLAVHQEALDLAEARLGADHETTLEAADDVAEALADLGRHREALRIYRTSIPAMEKTFGRNSEQVARARDRQKKSAEKAKGKMQGAVGAIAILGILGAIFWGEYGDELMSGDRTLLLVLGLSAVVAIPIAAVVGLVLRARLKRRGS